MQHTDDATDILLKICQAAFYIVGSIVAILTYAKAKRVLLNSVNTEYQKKVMDRLLEVVRLLRAEFDEESDHYWGKTEPAKEIIKHIQDRYLDDPPPANNKDPKWLTVGRIVTKIETRLGYQADSVVADPLIPRPIRHALIRLLNARLTALQTALTKLHDRYGRRLSLREAEIGEDDIHAYHNALIKQLVDLGWGVVETENKINNFVVLVQAYFESFDPLRVDRERRLQKYLLSEESRFSMTDWSKEGDPQPQPTLYQAVTGKIVAMVREISAKVLAPDQISSRANKPAADLRCRQRD